MKVTVHVIDVNLLRSLFLAGAQRLEDNKEPINMLNVFPVPDGDTGTNMSMTLQGAVREINTLAPRCDHEEIVQGYFIRIPCGCPRKFGSYSVAASSRIYPDSQTSSEPLDAPVLSAAMAKATGYCV